MEKLLNPKEVAEMLRISPLTVYSWIHRGSDIPFVKLSPGRGAVRFKEKSVQAWVDAKEKDRKRRNFED